MVTQIPNADSEITAYWQDLINPLPKSAVPVDFIKQIIFYYPDGEIVLDLSELGTDSRDKIEHWVSENLDKSNRVRMIVDVEKIKSYIEPITSDFLNGFFEKG